jgi:hypothetical protein
MVIHMREGSKWKNPRFRKNGGGDLYIEERYLKEIRAKKGDDLEYTVLPTKGGKGLIIRFRTKEGTS